MRLVPGNRVLFLLILVAITACLFTGFVSEAPNRLISGHPFALWQVNGPLLTLMIIALSLALLVLAFWPQTRKTLGAALIFAGALLLLVLFDAGAAASRLMEGARPATRIALGPAFWVILFCLSMVVIDAAQRLKFGPALRPLIILALALPIAAMIMTGTFDQLSIMREYASRRAVFGVEIIRHGLLVLGSVGLALLIGVPLGLLTARKPAIGSSVFSTLNLLQTIPSVAMFGLLIVPLSALASAIPSLAAIGIGGIGPAPAIIALTLYSLLPIARNTEAGITGVDTAIVDAASGLGFTPAQIFWRIELPLGMPTFLAGLRVTLVQTIGLAVVAALIGAGGLGTFVFQGIGQYATDLVLLGAIPTILLALAADFIVTVAVATLEERHAP